MTDEKSSSSQVEIERLVGALNRIERSVMVKQGREFLKRLQVIGSPLRIIKRSENSTIFRSFESLGDASGTFRRKLAGLRGGIGNFTRVLEQIKKAQTRKGQNALPSSIAFPTQAKIRPILRKFTACCEAKKLRALLKLVSQNQKSCPRKLSSFNFSIFHQKKKPFLQIAPVTPLSTVSLLNTPHSISPFSVLDEKGEINEPASLSVTVRDVPSLTASPSFRSFAPRHGKPNPFKKFAPFSLNSIGAKELNSKEVSLKERGVKESKSFRANRSRLVFLDMVNPRAKFPQLSPQNKAQNPFFSHKPVISIDEFSSREPNNPARKNEVSLKKKEIKWGEVNEKELIDDDKETNEFGIEFDCYFLPLAISPCQAKISEVRVRPMPLTMLRKRINGFFPPLSSASSFALPETPRRISRRPNTNKELFITYAPKK